MKAFFSSIYAWADERLGLEEWVQFAKHKTVPVHSQAFWYYWGGLSLFFFVIQCVTGVLLLLYYRPGPEAYDSVRQITYDTDFGWLVRSVHSWSANLMVAAIFVHMFSVFFMKAYRKPREFGWWSGVGLLGMTMIFGFSGYLLPMDELAYFATKVGMEIPSTMPVIGPKLADLVRGGPDVNAYTVQRFFALHVVVLPAIFLLLLGFHLWLVQKHGNAVPPSEEAKPEAQRKSEPFVPTFMMKDFAMWLVAFNVLCVLAFLFPWDLGPQADVLKPSPLGIHPEWYFMSQFQVLKIFGDWFPGTLGEILGIGVFTGGMVLWFLIPLYDNTKEAGRRARRATYFGLFALIALMVTTIWAYLAI
ncbi:MAG: cytochrome bc complex cytochrome b subunit [Verrucomicrobia bacterium]|nr:cytochrome bc complex cytochrome b subunit [Verrucomicrobiota bacterium]